MKKRCLILLLAIPLTVCASVDKEAVQWNRSDLLKQANEPDLIALATNAIPDLSILRFTYMPTFGNPIIVRMTRRADIVRIRYVIFNGSAGYAWGVPSEISSITVRNGKQIDSLFELGADFFSNGKDRNMKEIQGMDGETWLLERMDGGKYREAVSWIPKYNSKERGTEGFIRICEQLVRISGLSPKRDLDHLRRMELLDPLVDEDFEMINLNPPEPLLTKMLHWFQN